MIRVGPEDPPGTTRSISLEATRGEYFALQPVVRANTGPLNNVRVTASAIVGPGTISPENIEVYRESFLALPTSTPHQGTSKPLPPGTYPDGLIPTKNPADGTPVPPGAPLRAQNHTISAGGTQPYWVDVPMNHRIYGLLNQSVGATGLLYWTVDYWTSDPWANPYSWEGSYPGDGVLVYPGNKVGLSTVVPSMRLKYIRSAVQDYEYIELLSKAGRRDWALETIRPIARDWQHWSDDPNQLRAVRHSLAVELDRVTADGT